MKGIQTKIPTKMESQSIKVGKFVFVAIPFSEEFENVYDFGLREPIEKNGLIPIRIDKRYFIGSITDEIKKRIEESLILIADISTANPNVLFELGFGQGCGRPTIIISRKGEEPPFDVSGMNVIFYNQHLLRELNKSVYNALKHFLQNNGM